VPTWLHPRGLVEVGQLIVLQWWAALHRRLQRDMRRMWLREQWNLRTRLLQLRLSLQHGLVRSAPALLQRVPVRAVPPGTCMCRTRRVSSCHVCATLAVRPDVHDDQCHCERDGTAQRSLP
jgi:hypothetical protein